MEKFFEPIIEDAGVLLSEEQMGSIIFVAGRHIQTANEKVSVFLIRDLESILASYGYKEESYQNPKILPDSESL